MAWTAAAHSHEELCEQLESFGVTTEPQVRRAFKAVDRGKFVFDRHRSSAYIDAPIKVDNLHMSAPHMYAAVIEALQLQPGVSFLNVGSGSGWLSTMVAVLCGRESVNHGVELFEDMVIWANKCYRRFADEWNERKTHEGVCSDPFPDIKYFHGNAFHIDAGRCLRYDRIYVGAVCPPERQQFFFSLLAPDGVIVMPVVDELLCVHREGCSLKFNAEVVARVCFAPLLDTHSVVPQLPLHMWSPLVHRQFPQAFQRAAFTVLCVSKRPLSAASMIDYALWREVLSFTSRDWFPFNSPSPDFAQGMTVEKRSSRRRQTSEQNTPFGGMPAVTLGQFLLVDHVLLSLMAPIQVEDEESDESF